MQGVSEMRDFKSGLSIAYISQDSILTWANLADRVSRGLLIGLDVPSLLCITVGDLLDLCAY